MRKSTFILQPATQIIFCFIFTSFVCGNEISIVGVGQTAYPLKNNDVKMVEETVIIDNGLAETVFILKNTASKPVEIEIGFPEDSNTRPRLKDFKTFVDGKQVKVTIKKGRNNPKLSAYRGYTIWHTKKINFKPRETKTVKNTYSISSPYSWDG